MTKKQDGHVVLVGLNYQNRPSAGDKNFWFELLPYLARGLQRITILSVREEPVPFETHTIDDCNVLIRYISSQILDMADSERQRLRVPWRQRAFPRWLGALEKTLSGKRILKELNSLVAREPVPSIHLMDNFGPVNRLIARLPVRVSVSAMAYMGGNALFYHPYLRMSYSHPDLKVVPYSRTYCEKLVELGIPRERLFHIPWGVQARSSEPSVEERKRSRASLRLPADTPLFLWAGYLQQIRRKDFLFALDCAKAALARGIVASFFFAFKQQAFDDQFRRYHDPESGVYVEPTDRERFSLLKGAADVLYSPIINMGCIAAPPLTWIECMGMGMPILTTRVPGVGEIVSEGETGYAAQSQEDLVEKAFAIAEHHTKMGKACVQRVATSYNIEWAAQQYLKIWSEPDAV